MRTLPFILLLPVVALCQAPPYSLDVGSKMLLSLVTPINSAKAQTGDTVYLVTEFPVAMRGRMIIPVGSEITARITATTPSKLNSHAEMQIKFEKLTLPNGTWRTLDATLYDVSFDGTGVKGSEGALKATAGKSVPHCVKGTIVALITKKYPDIVLPPHTALEISLDKALQFYDDELVGR